MDIGKSFGFVFEDKKWIEKVLIGGILTLVPILGQIIILGYSVELIRNVRQYKTNPLPEWDNWGEKIAEGFKLFVIFLLWSLPLLLLEIILLVPMSIMGNSDTGSTVASIFSLCFGCLALIYSIVLMLANPSIIIKFAETGDISEGLKFGEILNFSKEHLGQIVVVVIVGLLAFTLAGIIGSLLCIIGLAFTLFWAGMVQYHMIAQIGLTPAPPERPLETLSDASPVEELPEASQGVE